MTSDASAGGRNRLSSLGCAPVASTGCNGVGCCMLWMTRVQLMACEQQVTPATCVSCPLGMLCFCQASWATCLLSSCQCTSDVAADRRSQRCHQGSLR